jgi:hypothetical protein
MALLRCCILPPKMAATGVRGAHVFGFRRSSSSPVLVLVGVPSMWRSGGAHGVLRRCFVGYRRVVPGLEIRRFAGGGLGPVLFSAGASFLGTLRWTKVLSWRPARTDDGDARGRRFLLEGVIEAGVS